MRLTTLRRISNSTGREGSWWASLIRVPIRRSIISDSIINLIISHAGEYLCSSKGLSFSNISATMPKVRMPSVTKSMPFIVAAGGYSRVRMFLRSTVISRLSSRARILEVVPPQITFLPSYLSTEAAKLRSFLLS